jgi:chromosome segregation protein
MNQITAQLNERRRAVESIRRKQSDLRVNCERVLIEQRTTTERLSEEYPEGFAQELLQEANQLSDDALISEDLLTKERNSLVQLRRRLQKEGEVDPSSIQAYEEENARLTELMLQKRDLEDGAKVLNESVNQVVSGAEKRLLHTFNIVQEKFQQLIPRVFGGGSGALTLSDPQNPLESGVAIMVRPPGKIPKSIDLLSGGEKALTATALIMALFSYAPSPLCVLDEVDAPLDEANLIRFLELIKEMSISTQFIIVTHNKQSMSMANRLVGVTMEQPGASKMISVSLQEAVAQVA